VRADVAIRGILSIPLIWAGCLTPTPLERPSQNGAKWMELSSKHFTLTTDLDVDDATLAIRAFELAYALLARAIFGDSPPPDFDTQVIVFRSRTELQEFVPDWVGGRYMKQLPSDLQPSPTMVIYGELSHVTRITYVHELAHRFNRVAFGSMPPWLDEGLAQFYSTVRGDPQRPEVGALDPETGFASGIVPFDPSHFSFQGLLLLPSELPSLSRLMDFEPREFYASGPKQNKNPRRVRDEDRNDNYAAAWALVHMLMTTESSNAIRFRQALGEAARIHNATLAIERMDLDADALDREFGAHLTEALPSRPYYEVPPPVLGGVRQHDLAEARTLVRWARLSSILSERGERYLRSAVAAAPQDPEVQFWFGRLHMLEGRREEAERLFKAALAQEPDNAGYQLGLVALYLGRDHDTRRYSSAGDASISDAMNRLTKIARTAAELVTVADYHLLENRPEVARPLAERACRVDPDCWECFHAYALATFRTGDVAGAVTLEKSALNRLPDASPTNAEMTLRQALRSYRTAAANPGAPPASAPTLFFPW
jgi:tetratricopeptide (TPR) repeat protein